MSMLLQLQNWPRERLAARVSAASYGSVLVLTALALINADTVGDGWGWELITGVGVGVLGQPLLGGLYEIVHLAPPRAC